MIYRNNTCTCISQEGSEKFIHVLNKKLLMKSKILSSWYLKVVIIIFQKKINKRVCEI